LPSRSFFAFKFVGCVECSIYNAAFPLHLGKHVSFDLLTRVVMTAIPHFQHA
jgi:hypothetical protein